MIGRITAKADGAQCSIASPRLLLTARDKPLSQLFTLRRVFLELELLSPVPRKRRAGEKQRATDLAGGAMGGDTNADQRGAAGAHALGGAPAGLGARGRPQGQGQGPGTPL